MDISDECRGTWASGRAQGVTGKCWRSHGADAKTRSTTRRAFYRASRVLKDGPRRAYRRSGGCARLHNPPAELIGDDRMAGFVIRSCFGCNGVAACALGRGHTIEHDAGEALDRARGGY